MLRFVASTLRGASTALQNFPTIVAMKAKEFAEAVEQLRNADGKVIEKQLNKMRDPKLLAKFIGVVMLLEDYAKVSLTAQSSKFFPSQVLNKVAEAQEKLQALAQNWKWEEEDMKLARIEAPMKIITRLVEEAIYRPKIFRCNVRKYRDLEEAGLIAEDETIEDLFIDNEPVKALAGETAMEALTWEDVAEVEAELQDLAGDLVTTWEERQHLSELDR
jgi:hypothetical protein